MSPTSSRELPGPSPRVDKHRDMREAIIEDADKTEVGHRDLEHGEGGTLGLADNSRDLNQDD